MASKDVGADAFLLRKALGDNYHASFVLEESDLDLVKCPTTCCKTRKIHCPLCPMQQFKPCSSKPTVRAHFGRCHWTPRVAYRDIYLLKCNLPCTSEESSHWHCPICNELMKNKSRVGYHLKTHNNEVAADFLCYSSLLKVKSPLQSLQEDSTKSSTPVSPRKRSRRTLLNDPAVIEQEKKPEEIAPGSHPDVLAMDESPGKQRTNDPSAITKVTVCPEVKVASDKEVEDDDAELGLEILEEVSSNLSEKLLALLPLNKKAIMNCLQEFTNITCMLSADGKACTLKGQLTSIGQASDILKDLYKRRLSNNASTAHIRMVMQELINAKKSGEVLKGSPTKTVVSHTDKLVVNEKYGAPPDDILSEREELKAKHKMEQQLSSSRQQMCSVDAQEIAQSGHLDQQRISKLVMRVSSSVDTNTPVPEMASSAPHSVSEASRHASVPAVKEEDKIVQADRSTTSIVQVDNDSVVEHSGTVVDGGVVVDEGLVIDTSDATVADEEPNTLLYTARDKVITGKKLVARAVNEGHVLLPDNISPVVTPTPPHEAPVAAVVQEPVLELHSVSHPRYLQQRGHTPHATPKRIITKEMLKKITVAGKTKPDQKRIRVDCENIVVKNDTENGTPVPKRVRNMSQELRFNVNSMVDDMAVGMEANKRDKKQKAKAGHDSQDGYSTEEFSDAENKSVMGLQEGMKEDGSSDINSPVVAVIGADEEVVETSVVSGTLDDATNLSVVSFDQTTDISGSLASNTIDLSALCSSAVPQGSITGTEGSAFIIQTHLDKNGQEVMTITLQEDHDTSGPRDIWTKENLVGCSVGIPKKYEPSEERYEHSEQIRISMIDRIDSHLFRDDDDNDLDYTYLRKFRDNPQGCPVCQRRFRRKSYLYWHIVRGSCLDTAKRTALKLIIPLDFLHFIQALEQLIQCPICPHCRFSFACTKTARVHYLGDDCQSSKSEYYEKYLIQKGLDFYCRTCNYRNASFFPANQHVMTKHYAQQEEPTSTEWFSCDQCGRMFASSVQLRRHKEHEHTARAAIVCEHCGLAVPSNKFEKHMTQIHGMVRTSPFETSTNYATFKKATIACTYEGCKFVAPNNSSMTRHIQRTHGVKDKPCDHCGEMFTHKSDLDAHVSKVHFLPAADGIKHHCPICNKDMLKKNLRKHIHDVHHKIRNYTCDFCGGKFQTLYTLKCHQQLHLPEEERTKNYQCEFCDKKFLTLTRYRTHKSMHTGQKLYDCYACEKSFSSSFNMKCHFIAKHTDSTYSCGLCHKKFREPKALRKHQRLVHQTRESSECPCGHRTALPIDMRMHKFTCPAYQSMKAKTFPVAPPTVYSSKDVNYPHNIQNEEIVQDHGKVNVSSLRKERKGVHDNMGFIPEASVGIEEVVIGSDRGMNTSHGTSIDEAMLMSAAEQAESSSGNLGNYMCGLCYVLYNSKEEVEKHMKVAHSEHDIVDTQVELKTELD